MNITLSYLFFYRYFKREGEKIFYINSSIPVVQYNYCATLCKNEIKLTITDNNIGFNIHQKMETPGLISMRERAVSINGILTVKSEIGGGTMVCISIAKNTTQ